MKYALIIAECDNADSNTLQNFAHSLLNNAKTNPNFETLNAGAYILSLEREGLSGLCSIVSEAKDRHIRLRTLFFDQEPAWVITR